MFDRYYNAKKRVSNWCVDYVPYLPYRIASEMISYFREMKWMMQRLLRSHHCSDRDLWSLSDRLSIFILPKLKAFRRSNLHGYPIDFCEYEEPGPWPSREEYEKDKAAGKVKGGEMEGWLSAIDEMIFAFEAILADEKGGKRQKQFFKKYNCDWHAKKPENKSVHYEYKNTETGAHMMTGRRDTPPGEPWVLLGEKESLFGYRPYYYDYDLHAKIMKRAQNGLKLFGEYLTGLWD